MAPVIPANSGTVINIQGAQNEVTMVQVDREDSLPEPFSSSSSVSPLPSNSPSISSPPSGRPSKPAQTEISPLPPVLGCPPPPALTCPDDNHRIVVGSTVWGARGHSSPGCVGGKGIWLCAQVCS